MKKKIAEYAFGSLFVVCFIAFWGTLGTFIDGDMGFVQFVRQILLFGGVGIASGIAASKLGGFQIWER